MKFNSSYIGLRPDLVKHITQKNIKVLDVGCATGVNGRYLLDNKTANYVVGVEIDRDMAEEAEKVYNNVYIGNLDDENFLDGIIHDVKDIDVILLGDVLEHLINPNIVLAKLSNCLSHDGKMIFSVPNIQHIDALIHIFIKGDFPLNDRGIFDKTHLRWFTLKNIKDLVNNANLKIDVIDRNYRYRDAIDSKFPFYKKILLTFFKKYYTFQYIIVCKKNNG